MKAGRFVQVGTAQQIVGSPADDYVAAFTQDIDRARVFTGHSVVAEAHALDLATDTPASAMERMARLERDALHVLDSGRLVGMVTYREIGRASGRERVCQYESIAVGAGHVKKKSIVISHFFYKLVK